MQKTVEDEADEVRMAKTEERKGVEKKKQEEEEDLIEIRIVEEMVPRQFHKYLKIFEKKKLERILIRKIQDHAIDFRKGFILK